MRTFAPGKIVLTGAYAVLHGAPAIVAATSRGAHADGARAALAPTPEVRAALGHAPAPHADASSMFVGQRKLGLGASAAILVASLAAREAERGADLGAADVREALFARARAAHASAQAGGSGVDVAASVHGGVLRYTTSSVARVRLPGATRVTVFACANSASTSALRAQVDRLADRDPAAHGACMGALVAIAEDAALAVERGDHEAFVSAVRRASRALGDLGEAASATIVPEGFDALSELAAREDAAFCVAGAGGGDVVAFVGRARPSPGFFERARALGLFLLDVDFDEKGVRTLPHAPAIAGVSLGAS